MKESHARGNKVNWGSGGRENRRKWFRREKTKASPHIGAGMIYKEGDGERTEELMGLLGGGVYKLDVAVVKKKDGEERTFSSTRRDRQKSTQTLLSGSKNR